MAAAAREQEPGGADEQRAGFAACSLRASVCAVQNACTGTHAGWTTHSRRSDRRRGQRSPHQARVRGPSGHILH